MLINNCEYKASLCCSHLLHWSTADPTVLFVRYNGLLTMRQFWLPAAPTDVSMSGIWGKNYHISNHPYQIVRDNFEEGFFFIIVQRFWAIYAYLYGSTVWKILWRTHKSVLKKNTGNFIPFIIWRNCSSRTRTGLWIILIQPATSKKKTLWQMSTFIYLFWWRGVRITGHPPPGGNSDVFAHLISKHWNLTQSFFIQWF